MADLSAFVAALNALPEKVERGVENGLDRAANVAMQMKNREIQKTYARQIPRSGTGRPKWDRLGDWQNDQRIESSPGERNINSVGPSEAYEDRLANLPTGPDGINRSNPAAEKARDIVEPQLLPILEQEILNEIQ